MKTLYESLLDDEEELLDKNLFDIFFVKLKNRQIFNDFITSLQNADNIPVKLKDMKNGDCVYFVKKIYEPLSFYELYIGVVGSYMYEVSFSRNGGVILPIEYNIGSGRNEGTVTYAHIDKIFNCPVKKDTIFYKLSDSHINSFKKLLKKHDVDYTDKKIKD